jgi:hypothetical protein
MSWAAPNYLKRVLVEESDSPAAVTVSSEEQPLGNHYNVTKTSEFYRRRLVEVSYRGFSNERVARRHEHPGQICGD